MGIPSEEGGGVPTPRFSPRAVPTFAPTSRAWAPHPPDPVPPVCVPRTTNCGRVRSAEGTGLRRCCARRCERERVGTWFRSFGRDGKESGERGGGRIGGGGAKSGRNRDYSVRIALGASRSKLPKPTGCTNIRTSNIDPPLIVRQTISSSRGVSRQSSVPTPLPAQPWNLRANRRGLAQRPPWCDNENKSEREALALA